LVGRFAIHCDTFERFIEDPPIAWQLASFVQQSGNIFQNENAVAQPFLTEALAAEGGYTFREATIKSFAVFTDVQRYSLDQRSHHQIAVIVIAAACIPSASPFISFPRPHDGTGGMIPTAEPSHQRVFILPPRRAGEGPAYPFSIYKLKSEPRAADDTAGVSPKFALQIFEDCGPENIVCIEEKNGIPAGMIITECPGIGGVPLPGAQQPHV